MQRFSRNTLSDQVADALGRSIASGERAPGSFLPTEAELLEEFGTSRTVLREAVKMLTAKGLIDTRPRRGTMVKPETEWNLADPDILNWMLDRKNVLPLMMEFADLRLAVEPAAAALAAGVATEAGRQEMREAWQLMEAAGRGDGEPLAADIGFHVTILKASGNRFFYSLRFMVQVALQFSIRITNQRKGVERASAADHRKVLDAILARDPERAREAMRDLILETRVLLHEANEAAFPRASFNSSAG
ncbi:MAG TPA: FadR/GntR family transcriptional regulator [Hyphomonas sp.]|nr:FadR family transcriptional regulator [Hyphomonas sp.]MCB9962851.1 FadR family transcriptional regulator [Hyphomonas sp.]MCB9972811.1 FadR family transcriptional regulator [Hyphomonas sp.]HPE48684.1 FadR/GntR family transcriptional regulator [Hyphomonas sp.]